MTSLQPCGTNAAYRRHKRRGEPVDEACEDARRRYAARWASKKRAQYPIAECASCGEKRPIARYGWCESCCTRWYRDGRPDGGPGLPLDPREESLKARAEMGPLVYHQARRLDEAVKAGGWAVDARPQTAARAREVVRGVAPAAWVDELLEALGLAEPAVEHAA